MVDILGASVDFCVHTLAMTSGYSFFDAPAGANCKFPVTTILAWSSALAKKSLHAGK